MQVKSATGDPLSRLKIACLYTAGNFGKQAPNEWRAGVPRIPTPFAQTPEGDRVCDVQWVLLKNVGYSLALPSTPRWPT